MPRHAIGDYRGNNVMARQGFFFYNFFFGSFFFIAFLLPFSAEAAPPAITGGRSVF